VLESSFCSRTSSRRHRRVRHPARGLSCDAATCIGVVRRVPPNDIRTRKIPNWLVLSGLCLGITLNAILLSWQGAERSVEGALLAFGVYFALYSVRAMGAGDVKLMAAVGSLVGPKAWFAIFAWALLSGGCMALALLIGKKQLRRVYFNVGLMLFELAHLRAPYLASEELDVNSPRALRMAHGVAIALGSLIYFVSAPLPWPH
jgi:prepilin peptidase CpaA